MSVRSPNSIKLFLAGDVMLGRLVDQIFPVHCVDEEEHVHAMNLIKHRNPALFKTIQEQGHKYVWGDVLPAILSSDIKMINLETSVTTSDTKWPRKAFNYRMHPANLEALKQAKIDFCSLANNHTLDFGYQGLVDTMKHVTDAGIQWSGVGMTLQDAMKPAIIERNGFRLVCYSFSDHPEMWASTATKPGVNYLDVGHYKKREDIEKIKAVMTSNRKENDVTSVSIHWGSNYAWIPPSSFVQFAHDLIDECGVDMIHGHSSHHIQGIEIYRGKPILYGCGDFIDDYAVDPDYRNDLGMAYFLHYSQTDRKFTQIELMPTKIHLFGTRKLQPQTEEHFWVTSKMLQLCKRFGTKVEQGQNGTMVIPLVR